MMSRVLAIVTLAVLLVLPASAQEYLFTNQSQWDDLNAAAGNGIQPYLGDRASYIAQCNDWTDGTPIVLQSVVDDAGHPNPDPNERTLNQPPDPGYRWWDHPDHLALRDMSQAARALSYCYKLTDDATYGNKAIEILDYWFVNATTKMDATADGCCSQNAGISLGFVERLPSFWEAATIVQELPNYAAIETAFEQWFEDHWAQSRSTWADPSSNNGWVFQDNNIAIKTFSYWGELRLTQWILGYHSSTANAESMLSEWKAEVDGGWWDGADFTNRIDRKRTKTSGSTICGQGYHYQWYGNSMATAYAWAIWQALGQDIFNYGSNSLMDHLLSMSAFAVDPTLWHQYPPVDANFTAEGSQGIVMLEMAYSFQQEPAILNALNNYQDKNGSGCNDTNTYTSGTGRPMNSQTMLGAIGTNGWWKDLHQIGGGTANNPPSVSIDDPPSGADFFTDGEDIPLVYSADDTDGTISVVRAYWRDAGTPTSGETIIDSNTAAADTIFWLSVPEGSYDVRAEAQDNAGATSFSSDVRIDVQPAPVVESGTTFDELYWRSSAIGTFWTTGVSDDTLYITGGGNETDDHAAATWGRSMHKAVKGPASITVTLDSLINTANLSSYAALYAAEDSVNTVYDSAMVRVMVHAYNPAQKTGAIRLERYVDSTGFFEEVKLAGTLLPARLRMVSDANNIVTVWHGPDTSAMSVFGTVAMDKAIKELGMFVSSADVDNADTTTAKFYDISITETALPTFRIEANPTTISENESVVVHLTKDGSPWTEPGLEVTYQSDAVDWPTGQPVVDATGGYRDTLTFTTAGGYAVDADAVQTSTQATGSSTNTKTVTVLAPSNNIDASEDTRICGKQAKHDNYGSSDIVKVKNTGNSQYTCETVLKFDLTGSPSYTTVNLALYIDLLQLDGGGGATWQVSLHDGSADGFDEGTLTWQNDSGDGDATNVGWYDGDIAGIANEVSNISGIAGPTVDGAVFEIDVTTLVNAAKADDDTMILHIMSTVNDNKLANISSTEDPDGSTQPPRLIFQ